MIRYAHPSGVRQGDRVVPRVCVAAELRPGNIPRNSRCHRRHLGYRLGLSVLAPGWSAHSKRRPGRVCLGRADGVRDDVGVR